jgi:hypothetical protein
MKDDSLEFSEIVGKEFEFDALRCEVCDEDVPELVCGNMAIHHPDR